jgi:hypothetical protein
MMREFTTGSFRYSPVLRLTNSAIGTPQARWRLITQSGRPSTIARMRFFERAGTQRVFSMAARAISLSPSPLRGGVGEGVRSKGARDCSAVAPPTLPSPARGEEK